MKLHSCSICQKKTLLPDFPNEFRKPNQKFRVCFDCVKNTVPDWKEARQRLKQIGKDFTDMKTGFWKPTKQAQEAIKQRHEVAAAIRENKGRTDAPWDDCQCFSCLSTKQT